MNASSEHIFKKRLNVLKWFLFPEVPLYLFRYHLPRTCSTFTRRHPFFVPLVVSSRFNLLAKAEIFIKNEQACGKVVTKAFDRLVVEHPGIQHMGWGCRREGLGGRLDEAYDPFCVVRCVTARRSKCALSARYNEACHVN